MSTTLGWTMPASAIAFVVLLDGTQIRDSSGGWNKGDSCAVSIEWPADSLRHEITIRYRSAESLLWSDRSNQVIGRRFLADTLHTITADGKMIRTVFGSGPVLTAVQLGEPRRFDVIPWIELQRSAIPRLCEIFGYWCEGGVRRACP